MVCGKQLRCLLTTRNLAGPLSVGLLVTSTSRRTSVLLGLAATRIYTLQPCIPEPTGSDQGTVEAHEDVLDLTLSLLVDIYKLHYTHTSYTSDRKQR